jgi:uncharacterized protein involved in outer membrane biogenesis
VDFEVVGGTGSSKTLLLDTTDSLVVGEGRINLADETLDITVLAEPKDFSLLSLNAPVYVDGSFANPGYGVSPEALLPKIDFGDADDLPDHCARLREAL